MSESEYTNDPEALIEQAKEHKQEAEAKQDALLESVATGEEFAVEEHETVDIGEVSFTVKTSFTGATARKIDAVQENRSQVGVVLDTLCDLLTDQTVYVETERGDEKFRVERDGEVLQFYLNWFDTHDVQKSGKVTFKRLVEEPCELEQQRRQDVVESFRENEQGGFRRNVD